MPVPPENIEMDINKPKELVIEKILSVLRYQCGYEVLGILLEDSNNVRIQFSNKTGRIRQVFYKKKRFLSYKPHVGRFAFSLNSAILIHSELEAPALRVKVLTDIQEFIKKGRSVFSKHVISIDKRLRPQDEVLVVNQQDELLAIGKLLIPPKYYHGLDGGVAVDVKKGIKKLKK